MFFLEHARTVRGGTSRNLQIADVRKELVIELR